MNTEDDTFNELRRVPLRGSFDRYISWQHEHSGPDNITIPERDDFLGKLGWDWKTLYTALYESQK